MGAIEKVLSRNLIYRGKIIDLRIDNVQLQSGRKTIREEVEHEPAVAIIPLTEKNEVLLVRQYRHPLGEDILEIPAGIVEEGETFRDTAERELQEEVGYRPNDLVEVGKFYTSPGFSDEVIVVFVARKLVPSILDGDEDECIEVESVPLNDVPELLGSGKIKDCKTFAGLSWLLYKHSRREI